MTEPTDWSKEKPSDGGLSVEAMQEIERLRVDADEPVEPAPTGAEEEAEAI